MKIIDARKTDQIALILFNTDSTNNHLATQSPGDYEHVSIIQPFDTPQLSTIKYLREKIVLGSEAKADSNSLTHTYIIYEILIL